MYINKVYKELAMISGSKITTRNNNTIEFNAYINSMLVEISIYQNNGCKILTIIDKKYGNNLFIHTTFNKVEILSFNKVKISNKDNNNFIMLAFQSKKIALQGVKND